jgi:hypothetical protein
MNTITGLEAERVNQILKHAVDRLLILSYIPTSWDDDVVVDIKCQPVLNSLERLWMAEEQLKELEAGSTIDGKDIGVIKQMHRAARTACRNFGSDRESLQVVMSRPELQSEDFTKFIKYLNELKSQIMIRLTTTVEDEAANRTMLHELTERERQFEDSREILQTKLNEVRQEKGEVSMGLDQTLRKLENELNEIQRHNSLEVETVQSEMGEAINKATNDHAMKMRLLNEKLVVLEKKAKEVVDKNKEEEQKLRKEKSRVETTLNEKIHLYDEDMRSRNESLTQLESAFNLESAEYRILKIHFDKIDADISRNEEEEEILAAVKRRDEFGRWVCFHAAATIQKIVRGKRDRALVEKVKSKSKKGKKGKK